MHFRRIEDTVISCRTEKLLKIRIGAFNSIFKCFIFKFVYNERPLRGPMSLLNVPPQGGGETGFEPCKSTFSE